MDAEALDFPDDSFDRVLCGFGLMFFPAPNRALAEFRRVLKPGGRLGISTWRAGLAREVAVVLVELGLMEANDGPARPSFGEPEILARPLAAAGFADARVVSDDASFRFADVAEYWQYARSSGLRQMARSAGRRRVRARPGNPRRPPAPASLPDGLHLIARALLAAAER